MIETLESGDSSMVKTCTPEVNLDMTPRVGMYFHSLEEVYEFYNTYARAAGFGVRRG